MSVMPRKQTFGSLCDPFRYTKKHNMLYCLASISTNSSKINFILCCKNVPPHSQPMGVHVALVSKETNDLSQARD